MQLGQHLEKDQELPEVPALMRGEAAEWKPEELPITPTKPTKSDLQPPASWMAAPRDMDMESVSVDVRSEPGDDASGSQSPQPLMRGPGVEAFLRANGVDLQKDSEIPGASQDDSKQAVHMDETKDEDMRSNHGETETAEAEGQEGEGPEHTQHYSPPEASEAEEKEEEPVGEPDDKEIPVLLHAEQRSLRPAGKGAAKPMAAKAKPKGKAKSKAKAKANSKTSKAPDAPEAVETATKKRGWPKGKAKSCMKRPAAAVRVNNKQDDDEEVDASMQADDNKEKEAEEVKEQEKSKEEQEEPQEPEPKRIKKGVCLVSTEQKKYLKSSLGNIYV